MQPRNGSQSGGIELLAPWPDPSQESSLYQCLGGIETDAETVLLPETSQKEVNFSTYI